MSNPTYGDFSDQFPGVTVTTQGGGITTADTKNAIGTLTKNFTIPLWGHTISLQSDEIIECTTCEMEEEIPELLQMSSGFREVVYKLYVFGKFKNTDCEPEYEIDHSILHDDKTNIGYDPNTVNWMGDTYTTNGTEESLYIPKGQRFSIDGAEYQYMGGRSWMKLSNGEQVPTSFLVNQHGEDTMETHFGTGLVDTVKDRMARKAQMSATQGVQGPQIQGNYVMGNNGSVTVDGASLSDDEKLTLRNKLSEVVADKKQALRR